MRDEAKTCWLFFGPDVASSYFFKRKSVSHLNHEPSFGYRCYRQWLLTYLLKWFRSRGGGGHSTFFQVGVCGPDFRSVGLANWHLSLKRGACERKISKFGGLWAKNFQIWGLVSWKFPNLGACELKFGWKLRLLRLKFPNFLKRGSCELTLLLEMGPLRAAGEAWKGGLQGRTSPYPLSRSVPPPPGFRFSYKTAKMVCKSCRL